MLLPYPKDKETWEHLLDVFLSEYACKMSKGADRVYLVILNRAIKKNSMQDTISYNEFVALTGIKNRSTIQKYVDELMGFELITVTQRGELEAVTYYLNFKGYSNGNNQVSSKKILLDSIKNELSILPVSEYDVVIEKATQCVYNKFRKRIDSFSKEKLPLTIPNIKHIKPVTPVKPILKNDNDEADISNNGKSILISNQTLYNIIYNKIYNLDKEWFESFLKQVRKEYSKMLEQKYTDLIIGKQKNKSEPTVYVTQNKNAIRKAKIEKGKKLNAHELFAEFRSFCLNNANVKARPSVKQFAKLKYLSKLYEDKQLLEVMQYYTKNWQHIHRLLKITGSPTVDLMYGFWGFFEEKVVLGHNDSNSPEILKGAEIVTQEFQKKFLQKFNRHYIVSNTDMTKIKDFLWNAGYEAGREILLWYMENWNILHSKYNISGNPCLGVAIGFANLIQKEMSATEDKTNTWLSKE